MMDACELYLDGFHPVDIDKSNDLKSRAVQGYSQTERPPKYYTIDFGIAMRFPPGTERLATTQILLGGADKSVPELQGEGYSKAYNPFHTDIYCVGNMIWEQYVMVSHTSPSRFIYSIFIVLF